MSLFYKSHILILALFSSFFSSVLAEGTLELEPSMQANIVTKFQIGDDRITNIANYNSPVDKRLYIHIKDPANEKIYLGFGKTFVGNTINAAALRSCFYRIKNPNGVVIYTSRLIPTAGIGFINSRAEAVSPPQGLTGGGGGYQPIIVNPTAALSGDYYIEFSQDGTQNDTKNVRFEYIDITVANQLTPVKGRLWSKMWSLVTLDTDNQSESKFYIYTKDSVVTSFNMNGMKPFGFGVMSNELGTNTSTNFLTSRQSVKSNPVQNTAYPQYKLFLNNPDSTIYPSYITKIFLNSSFYNGCNTNTTCKGISINMTKGVKAEILLDLNGTAGFQSGTADVFITANLLAGDNCVPWDGKDGNGIKVPSTNIINMSARLSNGLCNFPIYDPETNPNGLIVKLVRPLKTGQDPNNLPILPVFWDDSKILAGTTSLTTGCIDPLGCHSWPLDFGNDVTMNSWWYGSDTIVNTQLLIDPYPVATAKAGLDKLLCQTTVAPFQVGTPLGTDPITYTYSWNTVTFPINKANAAALTNPTSREPIIDLSKVPSLNTTDSLIYELVVDNNGCKARDTMKILIRGVGNVQIYGKKNVCPNSKEVVYWIDKQSDVLSVDWLNLISSTKNPKVPISSDTVYMDFPASGNPQFDVKVTYQTTGCPTPTATFNVNIASAPKADPPIGKNKLCLKTENVQVYKVTPVAGSTYQWFVEPGKGTFVSPLAGDATKAQVTWNGGILSPLSGKVWVSLSYALPDLSLCTGDTAALTVVGLDPIKPLQLPDLEVCNNVIQPVEFKESVPSTIKTTYIWQPNNGFQSSNTNIASPSIKLNTLNGDIFTYNLTVIRDGCVHKDDFTLTVRPDARIENISGPNPVCTDAIGAIYTVNDKYATTLAKSRTWAVSEAKSSNVNATNRNESVTVEWEKYKLNAYVAVLSPSEFGCKDAKDTLRIDIISFPSFKPRYDSILCRQVPVTWSFKSGGDNGGTTYNWIFKAADPSVIADPPVPVPPNQDSVNATFPKIGLYYLSVKQAGGGLNLGENCVNPPDTLKINVFNEAIIVASIDTTICFKDTASLYVVGGASLPLKWYSALDRNNISKPTGTYKVSPALATAPYRYYVELDDPNCKAKDSVDVTVNPLPAAPLNIKEIEFCFEDAAVLTLNGPTLMNKYLWLPTNEASQSIDILPTIFTTDLQKQYVSLKVTDLNGCSNKDSVLLKAICDPRLFVPKAFSPNDDGYNDTLNIFGAHFQNFQIRVFNRWGEIIFATKDRNQTWDGTYEGMPVEAGVYPWILSYESLRAKDPKNPREEKGSITVVR